MWIERTLVQLKTDCYWPTPVGNNRVSIVLPNVGSIPADTPPIPYVPSKQAGQHIGQLSEWHVSSVLYFIRQYDCPFIFCYLNPFQNQLEGIQTWLTWVRWTLVLRECSLLHKIPSKPKKNYNICSLTLQVKWLFHDSNFGHLVHKGATIQWFKAHPSWSNIC